MSLPSESSLDDAETGIVQVIQEPTRISVALHLPLLYVTPSTRASEFTPSSPILNIRQIPQLEKPLPPIPPRPASVSKKLVNIQPELPLPRKRSRKRLENRPSRWIQFQLWFNTYR